MAHPGFQAAVEPLLDSVAILEWSFDTAWGKVPPPEWVVALLQQYGQRDRLLGHGVSYSLLSAQHESTHWLACLRAECQDYRYRQISEHFGWMAAGAFYQSAPLPMPLLPETLRLGRDRLKQLADVAQVPVGLENLAFAFGPEDVWTQGAFLDQLLEPVDGFLLLDLHNLYCQLHNFQIPAAALLERYPLSRVKQLHVSGGSWSHRGRIRRDTHDGAVPEAVVELLDLALSKCPSVETVILEQLGSALVTDAQQCAFRQDFQKIQALVQDHERR